MTDKEEKALRDLERACRQYEYVMSQPTQNRNMVELSWALIEQSLEDIGEAREEQESWVH